MASPIPVIDIAPLHRGAGDPGIEHVVEQIDTACRTIGFLIVEGHGVDMSIVDEVYAQARAFFALPIAQRLDVAAPSPGYPYGYNPFSTEALERSLGGEAAPDLKETFNVGPIDAPPRSVEEMDDPDERAVYAPNLWPAQLPGLRLAVENYYRAMSDLAGTIMAGFALALGLPADWFVPLIDRHGSALRVAHYPPVDTNRTTTGQARAGAHTDYGTLTILSTDGRPGLEVLGPDGAWHPVSAPPQALIINLGDLMARWTNDRWRSTMHRVVAVDTDNSRLSVPFFHNANWDARIECIADEGVPARYPPVFAGQHLMDKFRSTVVT